MGEGYFLSLKNILKIMDWNTPLLVWTVNWTTVIVFIHVY